MDAVRRSLQFAVTIGVALSVGLGRAELSVDICTQAASQQQQMIDFSANKTQPMREPAISPPEFHDSKRTMSELRSNQDTFTSEQLEDMEQLMYRPNEWHQKIASHEFSLKGIMTQVRATIYSDSVLHRYDDPDELKTAGGPETNHELCLSQLQHIVQRVEEQQRTRYDSKDINILLLMDSYGRSPAGLYLGYTFWTGRYTECLRSSIDIVDQGRVATRYCIASFAHPKWPKGTSNADTLNLKTAVCLPESCDSQRYKNKYQLVQQLVEFQASDRDKDQFNITSLYCLPHEKSPLRIWYKTPGTLLTVLVIGGWLSLLMFATIRNEQLRRTPLSNCIDKKASESEVPIQEFGLTGRIGTSLIDEGISPAARVRFKIYQTLSIVNNFKSLFNTTKASALMEVGDELRKSSHESENRIEVELNTIRNKSFVHLRVLEGIKVICMSYVILGHVLMCMTLVMKNGAELSHSFRPAYYVANLMPAFAVNAFFTITGLLTAYLLFKQEQGRSFMTSPTKWTAFIIYRYLRIMPMYALIVLYAKTIAKYTGSGPMWDYATSSLSPRRTCEEESWLWTLLFGANFKTPLQHCIPSAWYLANDFQFFMVTPFFLVLLHKRPEMGKLVLKLSIAAGYIAGFLSILLSDASDLRPVAQFMPHGFTTYLAFLNNNYTQPQYRIPAYLCGLLVGYALYSLERAKINHLLEEAKRNESCQVSSNGASAMREEPDWPKALREHGVYLSVFLVSLCLIIPLVSSFLPYSKLGAKLMIAVVMPTYHLLFALGVGIYILLATTGHANGHLNRFLSASFWKPLSRVSLCAVLINVEVCNYLVQTNEQNRYIDDKYHMGLNLLCLGWTYLVAIVLCVLFEAPIRAALNLLLSSLVIKAAFRQKKKQ